MENRSPFSGNAEPLRRWVTEKLLSITPSSLQETLAKQSMSTDLLLVPWHDLQQDVIVQGNGIVKTKNTHTIDRLCEACDLLMLLDATDRGTWQQETTALFGRGDTWPNPIQIDLSMEETLGDDQTKFSLGCIYEHTTLLRQTIGVDDKMKTPSTR